MAALGVHQGLSPVLDVVRDYRWGRVEETIGEDPYLVAMLGAAYVRGLQSAGVIATLKHFAGYSASRAARNHGPVSMGRRELLDVILPTFETAVRDGGAGSVMNSYSDIDGVPAGADTWLLTEVLRDQWGFTGTVVSDYWAVPFLATMHRVAADIGDAGALALAAGIDVELPDTVGYGADLLDLGAQWRRGRGLVDRAARRLLTQKAELGLLDAGWTPEHSVRGPATSIWTRPTTAHWPVRSPSSRSCCSTPAPHSPCWARPPGVGADRRRRPVRRRPPHVDGLLLVSQPCRAEAPGHRARRRRADAARGPSCRAAGRRHRPTNAAARSRMTTAPGSPLRSTPPATRTCASRWSATWPGCSVKGRRARDATSRTSGCPACRRTSSPQLLAVGTPVVVVVVSGRPYALGDIAPHAAALVQAFMPGEEGGPALAGILSGRVQPSGKLPVQIRGTPAGSRRRTSSRRWVAWRARASPPSRAAPLFPFGYGRSYTTFAFDDVRLERVVDRH